MPRSRASVGLTISTIESTSFDPWCLSWTWNARTTVAPQCWFFSRGRPPWKRCFRYPHGCGTVAARDLDARVQQRGYHVFAHARGLFQLGGRLSRAFSDGDCAARFIRATFKVLPGCRESETAVRWKRAADVVRGVRYEGGVAQHGYADMNVSIRTLSKFSHWHSTQ